MAAEVCRVIGCSGLQHGYPLCVGHWATHFAGTCLATGCEVKLPHFEFVCQRHTGRWRTGQPRPVTAAGSANAVARSGDLAGSGTLSGGTEVIAPRNHKGRRRANRNSKSGVWGVSWYKPDSCWQGAFRHNARQIHVGYFTDVADAEAAVSEALDDLARGEFDAAKAKRKAAVDAERGARGARIKTLYDAGLKWVDITDEVGCSTDTVRQVMSEFGVSRRPVASRTSRVPGVLWAAHANRWRAVFRHEGKRISLGYFAEQSDAEAAVIAKRRALSGPPATCGAPQCHPGAGND